MSIAFLVGNGFDIRIGLKTRYKDIEKEYIEKNKDNENEDIKFFINSLTENKEYWSDFEIGLGKYTGNFDKNEQKRFLSIYGNFLNFMADYLEAEEGKIHTENCETEIQDLFKESIEGFCKELPLKNRENIQSILNGYGSSLEYKFISFNYTHTLDRCIELTTNKYSEFGSHIFHGTTYKHRVSKEIAHVHGELPETFIVGVDNTAQLLNEEWKKDNRFCTEIIKPKINDRIAFNNDINAQSIINNSLIFCIFGMSIGDTDKTWWKLLGRRLLEEPNARLIIYANSHARTKRVIIQDRIDIENEKKDLFMTQAEIPENDRAIVENKIFVILDSKIFDINLVELSKQKKSAVTVY